MKLRLIPLFLLVAFSLSLCLSCRPKSGQKQCLATSEEIREKQLGMPDTIDTALIRIYADLIYDSVSYVIISNQSHLPITYDGSYRFEQNTYGTWKDVKVRQYDNSSAILQPGEIDTLKIDLKADLGYQPIGSCRIYKTVRTLNGSQCFELLDETDTRTPYIDWRHADLILDKTIFNTTFVNMTAYVTDHTIYVTLRNLTEREITLGDSTNFTLSVFRDNQWNIIAYSQLQHDVAILLSPHGIIESMAHPLPDIDFKFQPGRYRIYKQFFFGSDYKNKYVAGAEFVLGE